MQCKIVSFWFVNNGISLFILLIFFNFLGHRKARDPNLKPSRPKFGSRPIVLKPLVYTIQVILFSKFFKFKAYIPHITKPILDMLVFI